MTQLGTVISIGATVKEVEMGILEVIEANTIMAIGVATLPATADHRTMATEVETMAGMDKTVIAEVEEPLLRIIDAVN